jgi:hypothetical protein
MQMGMVATQASAAATLLGTTPLAASISLGCQPGHGHRTAVLWMRPATSPTSAAPPRVWKRSATGKRGIPPRTGAGNLTGTNVR